MTITSKQIKELICDTHPELNKNSKTVQLYNAAVRLEMVGGEDVLEAMTVLHHTLRELPKGSPRDGVQRAHKLLEQAAYDMREHVVNDYAERIENDKT